MYFDFLTLVGTLMVLVTLILQIVATRRVKKEAGYDPDQRRLQLWLIWLLPIFGAAIVLSVLHDDPATDRDRQGQRDA